MKPQKVLAEFLGTFTLTLLVSLSLQGEFALPTPVVAGLTLGLFVYTVGGISGAHLNPAITFALATVGKIKTQDAVAYILSQLVAALAAWGVLEKMYDASQADLVVKDTFTVGMAEAMGAFFLAFAVCAVVHGKVRDEASGLVIGGSLLMGILATGWLSNGVLNPAVALGIGSFSTMYVVGPLVGAVAAMWLYRYLAD